MGENRRFSPTVNLRSVQPNTHESGSRSVLSEWPLVCSAFGGVAERSNAAVSKTVIHANGSEVQILSPPLTESQEPAARAGFWLSCVARVRSCFIRR